MCQSNLPFEKLNTQVNPDIKKIPNATSAIVDTQYMLPL